MSNGEDINWGQNYSLSHGAQIVHGDFPNHVPLASQDSMVYQEIGALNSPQVVSHSNMAGNLNPSPEPENIANTLVTTEPTASSTIAANNEPTIQRRCLTPAQQTAGEQLSADSAILLNILESTFNGRQILKKRSRMLSVEERKILSETIAPFIFKVAQPYGQEIVVKDYEKWAQRVAALFPKEGEKEVNELYITRQLYEVAGKDRKSNSLAGTLVTAVTSLRRKSQRKAKSLGSTCADYRSRESVVIQPQALPERPEPDLEVTKKIDYLKNNYGPEETIARFWNDTHQHRELSLDSLETYPVLRENEIGKKLIALDFDNTYIATTDRLRLLWPTVSEAIWLICEARAVKVLSRFEAVPKEISSIFLIHYLLRPIFVFWTDASGVKKKLRSSVDESIKSVLLQCETQALLEEKIQAVIRTHEDKKLRLQPFMVIVGDLDQANSFYLVVTARVKYHFDNFMNCFDACFKVYFALGLEYPLFSYRFWLYIQREIFEIKLKDDKFTQISELGALLQPYMLS